MNNKKLFLIITLLFLAGTAVAQTTELTQLLDNYYAGVEAGDADKVLAVLISQDDEGVTKAILGELLTKFPQSNLQWEFVSEEFSDDSTAANMIFNLKGKITDSEDNKTLEMDNIFIALFVKESGDWKIARVMPLTDFTQEIRANNDLAEDATKLNEQEWQDTWDKEKKNDLELGIIDLIILLVGFAILIVFVLFIFSLLKKGKKKETKEEKKEENKEPSSVKVETKEEPKKEPAKEPKKEAVGEAVKEVPVQESEVKSAPEKMTKKEYSDAMKILRKRFAGGEITREDFIKKKKVLEG